MALFQIYQISKNGIKLNAFLIKHVLQRDYPVDVTNIINFQRPTNVFSGCRGTNLGNYPHQTSL